MEKDFLELTPTRFLCPYCGEWHEWDADHELGYYDSSSYTTRFECSNVPSGCNEGDYRIYFYDGYLHYSTEQMCGRASQNMEGKIPISSIKEDIDKPIVTFDVEFTSHSSVGKYECDDCRFKRECNCVKLGDKGDNRHMTITLGFEFEQSDYDEIAKSALLARKERELQERENTLNGREQSLQKRESALRAEELKPKTVLQSTAQKNEEDATMANNIFNLNMEFGPNNDQNITSTLMGVAVKNGNSWRIYDKKKKEITDIGDLQLGNLPIFILPTTKLNEGDLIKYAGEYYFVMKSAKGNNQFLDAKTGEMKTVVPTKNVLGFSCYSKVIAFSDSINMGDDELDVEKLAIMSAMCGQSGCEKSGQMNQLLPLMLFKDKLGGDDDMMNMMLMASVTGGQNAGMNQLLPLMLFKEKLGKDDDMMKIMLMTSMTGGQNAGMNQLLLLMLFKDKLDGEDDMLKIMLMTSMMSAPAESDSQNTGRNQFLSSEDMDDDSDDDDDTLPF